MGHDATGRLNVPDTHDADQPNDELPDELDDAFDNELDDELHDELELDDEAMFLRRRIRRTGPSTFAINLPGEERELLSDLPAQLRELLGSDDPAAHAMVRRLFPTAYNLDVEKDAEFHQLMREDLLAGKLARAELLESTAEATELSEEQLRQWMGAINDIRLVLGTRLDVGEEDDGPDPDDPDAGHYGLYHYLGFLLENVIRALSSAA